MNSKNFMEKSRGTQRWIAECHRLLDRCLAAVAQGHLRETRTAFELIFETLAQLDEGGDDIVFFADEAGSWQVGVNWRTVMPAWFRCLAATTLPQEYADKAHATIGYFAHYAAGELIPEALRIASKSQRSALSQLPEPKRTYPAPSFRS